MRLCRVLALLGVLVPAIPRSGKTQSPAPAGLVRIPYTTYIGLNPAIIPFDFGSLEVESGVAQGVTIGGIASYTDFDHDRWTSADFKLRYYPGEVVLRGFSIGLTAGYLRYSTVVGDSAIRHSLDAPTIGLVTDYNWLLGGSRRFVVGTGLGAKRVLAGSNRRGETGLRREHVTGRFILGLAF